MEYIIVVIILLEIIGVLKTSKEMIDGGRDIYNIYKINTIVITVGCLVIFIVFLLIWNDCKEVS